MMSLRISLLVLLLAGGLLSGCSLWSELDFGNKGSRLQDALQDYTSAKTASTRANGDTSAQENLTRARTAYEETALEAAADKRQSGAWYQARQILDTALEQVPDSTRLKNMHQEIDTERATRLRLSDCRLGAARSRFLVEKSKLLQARAPLEAKDLLQDWQTHRERQELDLLAGQLRDCAIQALADRNLELAEETLNAAALIHDEDFVSEERQQLELLKNPPQVVVEKPADVKPVPVKKTTAAELRLQKAGKARMALQSAMTRGDLRQAKTSVLELRELEGNTPQLEELNKSINDAIAAYIIDTHEKANALYRDHQIVQARDLWKIILELDPNASQARANLERAERVLKKLEELQGTTTDVQPAEPTPSQPAPTPLATPQVR